MSNLGCPEGGGAEPTRTGLRPCPSEAPKVPSVARPPPHAATRRPAATHRLLGGHHVAGWRRLGGELEHTEADRGSG